MINKIIMTENRIELFLLRISLGSVLLAHGVQKAFGWFGGFGWTNSINYFTGTVGIPSWLGAFVILIETVGAILLIAGFAGRINAVLMGLVMIGAFFQAHLENGFYMNWFGNQKGEGFEFDILFISMAVVLALKGSGAFSIDRWILRTKRLQAPQGNVKLAY